MPATVARLVLAMLILPATGAVFILGMLVVASQNTGGPPASGLLLLLWAIVYSFIAAYWLLLWRGVVSWTPWRIRWTLLGSLASLLCGLGVGLASLAITGGQMPPPFAILIGGGVVPIVWVLMTVLTWRETAEERARRLWTDAAAPIACPLCGYSLAGLREARCPECGSQFTLDQLLASQRAERTAAEV